MGRGGGDNVRGMKEGRKAKRLGESCCKDLTFL
jgi:hypothetical protein